MLSEKSGEEWMVKVMKVCLTNMSSRDEGMESGVIERIKHSTLR